MKFVKRQNQWNEIKKMVIKVEIEALKKNQTEIKLETTKKNLGTQILRGNSPQQRR